MCMLASRWWLLGASLAALACGPAGPTSTGPRRAAPPPPRDLGTAPGPTVGRCAAGAPGATGALPERIRSARDLGQGFVALAAGLRASELPPCEGRCPPPRTTLTLLDGTGARCFQVDVPVEHRRGPVGVPGGNLWLSGPDQVAAVGPTGRVLGVHRVAGPRLGPVALADGGAALVEGAGELVGFRATGAERYRRRLEPADPAQALARLPGGGVAVAFAAEVRGYDADGVPRFTAALPDRASDRGLALAGDTLWTWAATGAYRISLKGAVLARQPAEAPRTGRVYAAAVRDATIVLLLAEKGFHPVRVVAVNRTDVTAWSRPFPGDPPRDCRLALGPAGQVAQICPGNRLVVRDPTGITRYEAASEGPQRAALGPAGQFLVAAEGRDAALVRECRLLHYGPTGDEPRVTTLKGACPVPWFDAAGRRYAGSVPLQP